MKGCDDVDPISVSEGIYAQRRMWEFSQDSEQVMVFYNSWRWMDIQLYHKIKRQPQSPVGDGNLIYSCLC
jgi:hypothetical protein